MNIMTKITHYKLDDNRIWDIQNAQFTTTAPEDAVIGPCPDEQGKSTVAGLVACLEFYHFPLGELAPQASDYLFARLREQRDARLAECDYYVMPDYPATQLEEVKAYRQALRDLPAQPGAPWTEETIPWPVNPLEG